MFDTVEIKDVKNELGALVKALRKQRGLSQFQLAKSLDVSRTTIQNLELGKNFTVDTILKVMKEMDLLAQVKREVEQAKSHVINSKSMY
ncbi:MAG: helix-turn-helix transcriptional regulator [Saprospiraceae bacterium]